VYDSRSAGKCATNYKESDSLLTLSSPAETFIFRFTVLIDTPDNVDIKQRTDEKSNLLLLATLIFGAKNIDFYQKKKKKKKYGREFEDQ
jgi:hypothetical protein